MIRKSAAMRVVSWICVVLAVSTCAWEMCFAQGIDSTQTADSTAVEPRTPEIYEDVIPVTSITSGEASDDSLTAGVAPEDTLTTGAEDMGTPTYRKWWVWTLVTVAIAAVAVLVAGSSEKKADEDLPDFPDPPDR